MADLPTHLDVSIVAVDQRVWSGRAASLSAMTTEGSLGILPGHAPLLGQLIDGSEISVVSYVAEGETSRELVWTVEGGYLSVGDEGVSVIAEKVERETKP